MASRSKATTRKRSQPSGVVSPPSGDTNKKKPRSSSSSSSSSMEQVTGIGGFFFRAREPDKIAEWYATHLGVSLVPKTYEVEPWQQEAGATVFAPFHQETKYFGRDDQQWMINFRVRDLKAMVNQLQAAGITVELDPEHYPNGWFALVHDPEGNPIQLWQPESPTAQG